MTTYITNIYNDIDALVKIKNNIGMLANYTAKATYKTLDAMPPEVRAAVAMIDAAGGTLNGVGTSWRRYDEDTIAYFISRSGLACA